MPMLRVVLVLVAVVGISCDAVNMALMPSVMDSVKGVFAGLKSEVFRGVANQALQNHVVEERLLQLDVVDQAISLMATETGVEQGAFCSSDFSEGNYPAIVVNDNGQQELQFGLVSECLSADKEYSMSLNGAALVNFTDNGISVSNVAFSRVKSEGANAKGFDEQSLVNKLNSMNGVSDFVHGINRAMGKPEFMTTFKTLLSNPDTATQLDSMDKLVHNGAQVDSTARAGRATSIARGTRTRRVCTSVSCPGQCVTRGRSSRATVSDCCKYTMASACSGVGDSEDVEDMGATGSGGKTQCKCKGDKNKDQVCTVYPNSDTQVAAGDTVCCSNYCSSSGGCFAANTEFVLEDGVSVLAHQVRKGDRVMSVDGEGNVVYTLVTAATAAPAQSVFDIAVRTAKGHVASLGLTEKHMISAGGSLKLASQVEVGDEVHVVVSGDKQSQPATVESVTMQPTGPTYHITTMNHYAVASGVVSSVHTVDEKYGAAMSYLNTALYALPDSMFETVEWLMYTFALDAWQSMVSHTISA